MLRTTHQTVSLSFYRTVVVAMTMMIVSANAGMSTQSVRRPPKRVKAQLRHQNQVPNPNRSQMLRRDELPSRVIAITLKMQMMMRVQATGLVAMSMNLVATTTTTTTTTMKQTKMTSRWSKQNRKSQHRNHYPNRRHPSLLGQRMSACEDFNL
jgi:hypothetical protein